MLKIGVTLVVIALGAAVAATAASACGFHHAPTSVQSQAIPAQTQTPVSQGSNSQMTTTATTTTGKTTGS